jgi:rod shape-determining protein MreD
MTVGDLLKAAALTFLLAILQVSVAPLVGIGHGGADLVAILVACLVLLRGVEAGALAGFAGGFLIDAILGQRMGLLSLLYVLAALAIARVATRLNRPGAGGMWAMAVAAVIFTQAGYALFSALLGTSYSLGFVWRQAVLPSAFHGAIAALVLVPLLRRLFRPATGVEGAAPLAA